jgi:methionine aminopeptidase
MNPINPDTTNTITPDLTKYNTAAKICGVVYNKLKDAILTGTVLSVNELYKMGMEDIKVQCDSVFKKIKRKGVACPISINVNNYVDNYTYNVSNDIIIKPDDIVKIKLGVDIDGNVAMYGNTFKYCKDEDDSFIMFLTQLQKEVVKNIHLGKTNDDVRMLIESRCTEHECFPIKNCKSVQHDENVDEDDLPKYMILNYEKMYDKDEYLIQENTCFEFLENEIYTINITIVPEIDDDNNTNQIVRDQSNLYQLTNYHYGLKLKSSRALYSIVYNNHYNNIFDISEYIKDIKLKLGMPECIKNNVLEELPVYYLKNKQPVYSSIFTVCVQKKSGLMLKY